MFGPRMACYYNINLACYYHINPRPATTISTHSPLLQYQHSLPEPMWLCSTHAPRSHPSSPCTPSEPSWAAPTTGALRPRPPALPTSAAAPTLNATLRPFPSLAHAIPPHAAAVTHPAAALAPVAAHPRATAADTPVAATSPAAVPAPVTVAPPATSPPRHRSRHRCRPPSRRRSRHRNRCPSRARNRHPDPATRAPVRPQPQPPPALPQLLPGCPSLGGSGFRTASATFLPAVVLAIRPSAVSAASAETRAGTPGVVRMRSRSSARACSQTRPAACSRRRCCRAPYSGGRGEGVKEGWGRGVG